MPRLLTRMSSSGNCFDQRVAAVGRPEIERGCAQLALRRRLQPADGFVDSTLFAAADDNVGSHLGKPLGCSKSDAAGGTGDECEFSAEIEIHAPLP